MGRRRYLGNCVLEGRAGLQTIVDHHLLQTGRRCFLVVESGRVAGLLTPHEIKQVERARWPFTTAGSVMRPLEKLRTVAPDLRSSKRWK